MERKECFFQIKTLTPKKESWKSKIKSKFKCPGEMGRTFLCNITRHVIFNFAIFGISLVVQWLRLCASTTGGMGLIFGQGTKILHSQKEKKSCHCPKVGWFSHRQASDLGQVT